MRTACAPFDLPFKPSLIFSIHVTMDMRRLSSIGYPVPHVNRIAFNHCALCRTHNRELAAISVSRPVRAVVLSVLSGLLSLGTGVVGHCAPGRMMIDLITE